MKTNTVAHLNVLCHYNYVMEKRQWEKSKEYIAAAVEHLIPLKLRMMQFSWSILIIGISSQDEVDSV